MWSKLQQPAEMNADVICPQGLQEEGEEGEEGEEAEGAEGPLQDRHDDDAPRPQGEGREGHQHRDRRE